MPRGNLSFIKKEKEKLKTQKPPPHTHRRFSSPPVRNTSAPNPSLLYFPASIPIQTPTVSVWIAGVNKLSFGFRFPSCFGDPTFAIRPNGLFSNLGVSIRHSDDQPVRNTSPPHPAISTTPPVSVSVQTLVISVPIATLSLIPSLSPSLPPFISIYNLFVTPTSNYLPSSMSLKMKNNSRSSPRGELKQFSIRNSLFLFFRPPQPHHLLSTVLFLPSSALYIRHPFSILTFGVGTVSHEMMPLRCSSSSLLSPTRRLWSEAVAAPTTGPVAAHFPMNTQRLDLPCGSSFTRKETPSTRPLGRSISLDNNNSKPIERKTKASLSRVKRKRAGETEDDHNRGYWFEHFTTQNPSPALIIVFFDLLT
ncbi:unnamed protein product [Microthlaspi erraticum]|uniref:Uncharacterized protein n=1 Tax=Microthlaspi erraticum TaxID=1685480 RepID=A0A6D2HDR6_9BRAS|nr:unnamed protein product [Microthlaspi erraticum]